MRRKPGALLDVELAILGAVSELAGGAGGDAYGYRIARAIKELEGAKLLTAHGTLYKALERLVAGGMLESEWEDPFIAAAETRPRRRFYRLTAEGQRVRLDHDRAVRTAGVSGLREGLQPS